MLRGCQCWLASIPLGRNSLVLFFLGCSGNLNIPVFGYLGDGVRTCRGKLREIAQYHGRFEINEAKGTVSCL